MDHNQPTLTSITREDDPHKKIKASASLSLFETSDLFSFTSVPNVYSFDHLITHNYILVNNHSQLDIN